MSVSIGYTQKIPRAATLSGIFLFRLIVGLFAPFQPFGNEVTDHVACDRRYEV